MNRFNYISDESIERINQENIILDHKNHWVLLKYLSEKTGESVYHITVQSFNGLDNKLSAKKINLLPFNGTVRFIPHDILVEMISVLKIKSSVLYVARFCGYRVHPKLLNQLLKETATTI